MKDDDGESQADSPKGVHKAKRVGIYCRVSTSDQSTSTQKALLIAHCEKQSWTVSKIYEDTASGSTAKNRQMLAALLSDCESQRIQVILVYKLDRLFRSVKGIVETLAKFNEWGTEFYSLTDNFSMDTNSGRLMMHLISAFSEFEVGLIRERVKAGIFNARARGVRLGRPTKVDAVMEIEIMRLRLQQQLSIRQIARRLGISKTAVLRVVQNPISTNRGGSG